MGVRTKSVVTCCCNSVVTDVQRAYLGVGLRSVAVAAEDLSVGEGVRPAVADGNDVVALKVLGSVAACAFVPRGGEQDSPLGRAESEPAPAPGNGETVGALGDGKAVSGAEPHRTLAMHDSEVGTTGLAVHVANRLAVATALARAEALQLPCGVGDLGALTKGPPTCRADLCGQVLDFRAAPRAVGVAPVLRSEFVAASWAGLRSVQLWSAGEHMATIRERSVI